MTETDTLLELTTTIAPPKVFTVDGEEYKLLGFEHLSKTDEARVQALFARFVNINEQLGKAKSSDAAQKLAEKLYEIRMQLLTNLTDLPREVAEKLPMSGQAKLMNAIRREAGGDGDDEDDAGDDDL